MRRRTISGEISYRQIFEMLREGGEAPTVEGNPAVQLTAVKPEGLGADPSDEDFDTYGVLFTWIVMDDE